MGFYSILVVRKVEGFGGNSKPGRYAPGGIPITEKPKRYTLMVLPNQGTGSSRALGFSSTAVVVAVLLVVAATATLTWFIATYRENNTELGELRYLHEVAETQRQQISALQQEFLELTERLRQSELVAADALQMLDREGLLKQSFGADLSVASPIRVATLSSRDGLSSPRQLLDRDLGTALCALEGVTEGLDERLCTLCLESDALLEEAAQAVDYFRAKPNLWPVVGRVSSEFGSRKHPITGCKDYHEGIDIAAAYGTPIIASADGVVTFSGYKSGYGYMVSVSHKYGFGTLYAHCSRLRVKLGQEVKRGDVVADVGQSGSATGPHVHYEVLVNGRWTDPRGYLP